MPDDVWISAEEYARLRAAQGSYEPITNEEPGTRRKQRAWQIIVGTGLALTLFYSVSVGSYANILLLGAIVAFALISLYDFLTSRHRPVINGVPGPGRRMTFKHNPYKILGVILIGVVVLPPLLLAGFFILFFSLAGGDMGS